MADRDTDLPPRTTPPGSLRAAVDAFVRDDQDWLIANGWVTQHATGSRSMTQRFCDASNRSRLGSVWRIVLGEYLRESEVVDDWSHVDGLASDGTPL